MVKEKELESMFSNTQLFQITMFLLLNKVTTSDRRATYTQVEIFWSKKLRSKMVDKELDRNRRGIVFRWTNWIEYVKFCENEWK